MHLDQQYIEALRTGNEAMIRQIYATYAPEAVRWITQRGGTVADARDVFQEAVMAIFEKSQTGQFVLTCPLGALLQVIYSRKWIDRLRIKKREEGVRNQEQLRYEGDNIESDALTLAEEALEAEASQSLLSRTFAQLSEVCQQLIRLLGTGMAPKEVAQQLQMNSVDTLYRRKNACAERWRNLCTNTNQTS
jgi:RNA polymerase sigma factor (sigma-70 family)